MCANWCVRVLCVCVCVSRGWVPLLPRVCVCVCVCVCQSDAGLERKKLSKGVCVRVIAFLMWLRHLLFSVGSCTAFRRMIFQVKKKSDFVAARQAKSAEAWKKKEEMKHFRKR